MRLLAVVLVTMFVFEATSVMVSLASGLKYVTIHMRP